MKVIVSSKIPRSQFPPSAIGVGCFFIVNSDGKVSDADGKHTSAMVYLCNNVISGDNDDELEVSGSPVIGGTSLDFGSSEITVVDIIGIEVERKAIEFRGVSVDSIRHAAAVLGGTSETDDMAGVVNMLIDMAKEVEDATE